MSGWNRGFALSASVIEEVTTLGLELDFDIYANGDDDDVLTYGRSRPACGRLLFAGVLCTLNGV